MAEKTFTKRFDDLDDLEIAEKEDPGVTFIGLNGVWYAIDLRASHFAELEKAVTPYIDKARKPKPEELEALKRRSNAKAAVSASGKGTGGSGLSKAERDELRVWAEKVGKANQIPSRGRLPLELVEEFMKAKAAGKV